MSPSSSTTCGDRIDYSRAHPPRIFYIKVTIHELVESSDTIVLHASSRGASTLGTPYHNEYALFFHFVPPSIAGDLPRICRVKEFVDSQFSAQFVGNEKEAATAAAMEINAQEDVDNVKV